MLCFWSRHFTLTVPFYTHEYKWVPGNFRGNLTKCYVVTCDGLASHPGGVAILLVGSRYRNWDKHRQRGPAYFLTAPNATDSIVCIRSWESPPSPCWGVVITPRLPTSCPPAKVQNLTCLTPHVTNWLSESGLNSATNILSVLPCELASLLPEKSLKEVHRMSVLTINTRQ